MYFKKIIGSFVYLSPVSIEDTEKWTEWLNDLSIAIPLGDEASDTITEEKTIKEENLIKLNFGFS